VPAPEADVATLQADSPGRLLVNVHAASPTTGAARAVPERSVGRPVLKPVVVDAAASISVTAGAPSVCLAGHGSSMMKCVRPPNSASAT